ncbi:hypothetical protein M514_07649 [Trichuris suis]|uniref:Uncharacterized protein n=1 Tax=Trichuris suis TaxID=68888 RepID=A0A085N8G8_9BILA|nr:hypothetical protein M514_07649 [Trichuris suis]
MAEANSVNGDVSGKFSFARYFPERTVSDDVDLECGTADALELLTKDKWISQKLCGGQQEDKFVWPPIVPAKQLEPPYRAKIPKWSAVNLPEVALRNHFLSCPKKPAVRVPSKLMRYEKLLAESLCGQSPCTANTLNLGNCLAVSEHPDKPTSVTAAFATGSQAKTLVVSVFTISDDEDTKLKTLEQISAVDWRFDSEIVQVELLGKLDHQSCCLLRLSQPPRAMLLRLNSDYGRTDLSTPFLDQALHVSFSPYVAGEYFAITPLLVRVGSLVSSESVSVDISAQTCFSFGDWSGYPSCIALGGTNGLALLDVRCATSCNLSLAQEGVSCLHCLHDNRAFLLYATETSVKLIDVRMPKAPIIQWKHMLLGSPKYIDSLYLDNHHLGQLRQVIVASRETNDATAFPLLQPSQNASLFCGLHPPKVSCTIEDFLLWQQAHRPMVAVSPSLRQRLFAPTRGMRTLRQGILIANDVGDLYFQNTIRRQECNSATYNKAFEIWNSRYKYCCSTCAVDLNAFYDHTSQSDILHYPPTMVAACKGDVPLGNFLSRSDVQVDVLEEQLDKQWLEESTVDDSLGQIISSCFVDQY